MYCLYHYICFFLLFGLFFSRFYKAIAKTVYNCILYLRAIFKQKGADTKLLKTVSIVLCCFHTGLKGVLHAVSDSAVQHDSLREGWGHSNIIQAKVRQVKNDMKKQSGSGKYYQFHGHYQKKMLKKIWGERESNIREKTRGSRHKRIDWKVSVKRGKSKVEISLS